MDNLAMNQLSYGVFVLATKWEDVTNGCITNTCMQVAGSPTRVAISVLNTNYTCELLKKSGIFTLSILDQSCTFETIKYFGFQSGRDVDKYKDLQMPHDMNDIPYMGWQCCAMLSGKVLEKHDLGTHTLFIAEVVDAKVLNDRAPLTYSDYHKNVKPQKKETPADANKKERKIIAWRCKICNYVYESPQLPKDYVCPLCGHGAEDFEPVYAEE